MRLKIIFLLLISVFSLFILFKHNDYAENSVGSDYEKCRLVRVVDGDTIIVNYKGKNERVRLTGIDTPEAVINNKAKKDSEREKKDLAKIVKEGKRAKSFAENLMEGENFIFLEFDVRERDHYGRILAYVYLADGRMVNDLMLKAGYATLMTVPPNVKYKDRFLKSYREARTKKRGLWAD